MNKEFLDSIIKDFSVDKFRRFFRVNQSFVPKSERVVSYGDQNFSNGMLLGMIPFDVIDLQLFGFEVKKSLNERSGKRAQYEIARKVLKERQDDAGIFIFYDRSGAFRFSLIYTNYIGGKRDWSAYRRFTFFADKALANVTFLQRIGTCDFTSLDKVKDAFSVEKVTSEFFDKYKEIFFDLVDQFSKNKVFVSEVVEKKKIKVSDFVKKLMGQIVFIYFLQKKGWLGVGVDDQWGQGDQNFVKNLYAKCLSDGNNFYNDFIEPLFYDTLGNRYRGNDSVKNDQSFSPYFQTRIPYLNGGLFEDFYNWRDTTININNDFFGMLIEFFDQYNFTVDENTPSDQEISIDPEMLGKIFEKLLEYKDRKSKGAYYTPREIVHYMCQESMVNYLISETGYQDDRIRRLIKSKDRELTVKLDEQHLRTISQMTDLNEIAKKVDAALQSVKVLDPAVGSGAFPMGMLSEITSTRYFLNKYFLHNKDEKGSELTEYHIKKETLENCIYGVDIDPGAVDIAKLRFWLALVVDHNIDDIEPLPNLDYKLMQGNSLIENFEGINLIDNKYFENSTTAVDSLEKYAEEQTILGREFIKLIQSNQHGTIRYRILESRLTELKKVLTTKNKVPVSTNIESSLFDEPEYIKESKIKAKKLLEKQKEFFNTKDPQRKKDLKREIDDLAWELIESTLREEGREDKIEELRSLKELNERPYFLFKLHFAEVFQKKGGFDIVIANPPYIEFKSLSKSDKKNIENSFITADGKYDIYIPFCEKSVYLLRKNGVLSFINPTRFMHRDYGKKLRSFMLENVSIKTIIDFNDYQVFDEALAYTGVFVYQKICDINNNILYKKIKTNLDMDNIEYGLVSLNSNDKVDVMQINQSNLSDKPWYVTNNENEKILEKIKMDSIELIDICKGIYQGIATGKDSVFIVNDTTIEKFRIESDVLIPLLKGKDIHTYRLSWKNTYVIYPYNEEGKVFDENYFKNKFPNCYKYLTDNKHELLGRDYFDNSNKLWFELWNQRNILKFKNKKIITLDNASKNSFTIDNSGFVGSTTSYSISIKPETEISYEYLLSVLNSRTLDFFHKKNTVPQAGGFYRYQASFIKSLPIKKISFEKQKPFIEIVDKILAITKSNDYLENPAKREGVKKYENQIDQMVYKLYDLTPEEIKIIEESVK